MSSDIILIGPIGVGKSTVGSLLAARIGLPQRSMDEYRWNYYQEIGYDEELAKHKRETEGFWGVYQYWKPFEAHESEVKVETNAKDYLRLVSRSINSF